MQSRYKLRLPPEPRGLHPQGGEGGEGWRSQQRSCHQSCGQPWGCDGPAEHRDGRQEEHGDTESEQQHHQDYPVQS